MKNRVLALAGVLQAADCVVRLARDGRRPGEAARPLFESVFRLDAASPEAVYGSAAALRPGLELVAAHAGGNPGSSAPLARIAFTVLQVERSLAKRSDLLSKLQEVLGLELPDEAHGDVLAPLVCQRLGDLYGQTISTLTPRVMVQGDPDLLSRSDVVASIRALLLAAVRSAVLWRQLGGSQWDFFLRRGQIRQAAMHWLRGSETT